MRASHPFAHDRHLVDPTRASLTGSTRGRGAYPFSRRDLLRAGAAGLVGLGLPLVASPRARADQTQACFPGGNVLFWNGLTNSPINVVDANGRPSTTFVEGNSVCAYVQNTTNADVVVVWNIYDAPNANAFKCCFDPNTRGCLDFLNGQLLESISSPCTVPAGQTIKCCTPIPGTCAQGDLINKQGDMGWFPADLVSWNPAVVATPVTFTSLNFVGTILLGSPPGVPCQPCCMRMTGGGGTIPTTAGGTVETSQGFQLRTGVNAHSNLEVHWTESDGTLHKFKYGPSNGTGELRCGYDNTCSGGQPLSQPNMIFGQLTGTLDGQAASMALNFVDCGEPGTNDTRQIIIFVQQGASIAPVVLAQGTISNGNNQAHKC